MLPFFLSISVSSGESGIYLPGYKPPSMLPESLKLPPWLPYGDTIAANLLKMLPATADPRDKDGSKMYLGKMDMR